MRFVAVLERHKNRNVPHIHGFTNIWLAQLDWSRHWEDSKGGKIVWIERVKDGDASAYVSKQLEVAKYVGKDQLMGSYEVEVSPGRKKRVRTLWRSENTKAKFELTKEEGWDIIKAGIYQEDGSLTDFAAKRGVWADGKKKQTGKDVEATCGALSPQSIVAGVTHLETEEGSH